MIVGVAIAALLALIAIVAILMARWVFAAASCPKWPPSASKEDSSCSLSGFLALFESVFFYDTLYLLEGTFAHEAVSVFQEKEVLQTPVVRPHRGHCHRTLRSQRDKDSLRTCNQKSTQQTLFTRVNYQGWILPTHTWASHSFSDAFQHRKTKQHPCCLWYSRGAWRYLWISLHVCANAAKPPKALPSFV